MKTENIRNVTDEWIGMTHKVLALKRIPSLDIRELFKRSYEVLDFYHKDALVPKEVSELLLEMDGFLYFASLITDKEFDDNPYLYQAVHSLAEALKIGFFAGVYECKYPILKVINSEDKLLIFDFEKSYVEDLI